MPDSFFSTINSVKTIIFYGFQLKNVSNASRNAKATLERVLEDLNILRRRAGENWANLKADQRQDINKLICDTNEAIYKVAKPIRASRRNVEDYGTVTLYRRIQWTVSDGDDVKAGLEHLKFYHESIGFQLSLLSPVPDVPLLAVPEAVKASDGWYDVGTVEEREISEDMWQDRRFWSDFTNNDPDITRSTKSESLSSKQKRKRSRSRSAADDESRRSEMLGSDTRHELRHTSKKTPSDYAGDLAEVGTSIKPACSQSNSPAIDYTLLEEFNARREEDKRRRGPPIDDYDHNAIDDELLQEFRVRKEEDARRRSGSRTPSAAPNS